jgi:prolyl oligopeptidase
MKGTSNRAAPVAGPASLFWPYLFLFVVFLAVAAVGASYSQTADSTRQSAQRSQTTSSASAAEAACPPAAKIDNVKDTYGSTVVTDPYRWLEDQNSPATRAWINAENACTAAALGKVAGRDTISQRLAALYHTDTYQVPVVESGRYFFAKRLASQDLSLIYMRRSATATDEVLVDPLPWSADHSVSATLENVSHSGRLLFYGRREGGQDETTVHVMDVDAHRDLPDVLPRAVYFSVSPTPDDKGVYYARSTASGPGVGYHAFGTDPAKDKVIYTAPLTKDKIPQAYLSDDGQFLAIAIAYGSGSQRADLYLKNVKTDGPVMAVVNDLNSLFSPHFGGDTLYIVTNWNAPNWHVFSIDAAAPSLSRDHWREIIPASDVPLEDISAAGGKLFGLYTRDGSSEVKVFSPNGKSSAPFPLPTLGSVENFSGEWDSPEVLYEFESFNAPSTIYDYKVGGEHSDVWAQPKLPFDPSQFETKQVWFESKDKTRVPMFVFSKKGTPMDGQRPVILTGYGGFDINETPFFSPSFIVMAETGGVLADVNLRGGGEFGESWHQAGMLANKQNVFDDFAAAAMYLENNKYTNASKLSIYGGSNGGLLMGASLTQHPELFRAVVCVYPLLDMLRYQKFLDGSYWVPEYGSSDDPKQFAWLYAYSPYQHVQKGTKYPATLFITGDGDTRVAPLHARKMAALLQASQGDADHPVLLLYDTKSGHSGGRPVNKQVEEYTNVLSFIFWQLGVSTN